MRPSTHLRALPALFALACCVPALLSSTAAAAQGDPLFILRPAPPPGALPPFLPPPAGKLEGPCGLAVDAGGDFYVSDYFHHAVDVYTPAAGYLTQLAGEDPLDGPCGLALDGAGDLYVDNFDRNIVRYGPASGFGAGTVLAGAGVDSSHPTGVAVDGSGTVFVDERDHLATFDSAGVEGEPIGIGSLDDGYGVAVSAYPASAGFLYVADAATESVKVYDPAASRTNPVAQIDGSGTPPGGFLSLRDAAVAVDDASGTVYVVDDLTPEYSEGHEAVVYAFGPTGSYLGRLKFAIETALPAGLAVDNSANSSQGRVYVASGYSEEAAVYAYPPGAAGEAAVPLPSLAPATPSVPVTTPVGPAPATAISSPATPDPWAPGPRAGPGPAATPAAHPSRARPPPRAHQRVHRLHHPRRDRATLRGRR